MDKGYDSETIHRQIQEDHHPIQSFLLYPGITIMSGELAVRKWLVDSMLLDTEDDNWSKTNSPSLKESLVVI
jgi:hypothetical protein